MADIHITRELLWAVLRGELPPSVVAHIGIQHLMSVCPACRLEITAFQKDHASSSATGHSQALQLLPGILDSQRPRLEQEEREAARDLEILLTLPCEDRAGRVHRARNRFRSPALVRLLIGESRKRIPADPEGAFHLAELARTVAHHNPQSPVAFDLIVLATAHMANACRVDDDPLQADEHFAHARYVIRHHGVTDPEILALLDHLEGSLRMDRRQLSQAEALLARSAMLYRVSGDKVGTARALVTLGGLYFFKGDLATAIETTGASLELLKGTELRLYLCARYNLARYLTEGGRYPEAAEILSLDESLYRELQEPWTRLRLIWLRGKIAAGLGKTEEAERAFLETRDGFLAEGSDYDAAMVAIEDLSRLYLRTGRTEEVKRLVEEVYPVLLAQGVDREAIAKLVRRPPA